MKRGKKYQDAVKAYDRAAQYDVADAIDIVNLMRQSNFILERAVMDATQSSRSVVRLYCHTEQVRPLRYWFSQREPR